jgi:hypothetical protein
MQSQDHKRSIGYDFDTIEVNDGDLRGRVPKVRWLRVEFESTTLETALRPEILASHEAWTAWVDEARKVQFRLPST